MPCAPGPAVARHVKWTRGRFGRARYWGRDCRDADECQTPCGPLPPEGLSTARSVSRPQAPGVPFVPTHSTGDDLAPEGARPRWLRHGRLRRHRAEITDCADRIVWSDGRARRGG